MFKLLPLIAFMVVPPGEPKPKDFEQALRLPEIGQHELRVLAPRLLELHRITTQDHPGGWELVDGSLAMVDPVTRPQDWDFLERLAPAADAPTKDSFRVTVGENDVAIERIGFRRRPYHASKDGEELRISHSIYLLLGSEIPTGATVTVSDRDDAPIKWLERADFTTQALANRYSTMIHTNEVGYGATWEGYEGGGPKKAYLHGFFGDLGWLLADEARGEWVVAAVTLEDGPNLEEAIPVGLPLDTSFELIDAETSAVVYQSAEAIFTVRRDNQWPTYDGVLEMDFSNFVSPGNYRLRVPGFGASAPFLIGDAMPKQLTRTLALGLYHQRSGQDHTTPYTRFVDPAGHLAPATMPFDDHQYAFTYGSVAEQSNLIFTEYNRFQDHPAPQIRSPESNLFPYVGDVVAWWPFDGKEVVAEGKVVAGFNAFTYADSITITDPFGGHPEGNAFGDRPARSAFPGRGETDDEAAITPQQSFQTPDGEGYRELGGFYDVGFINTYQIHELVDNEESPPPRETRATGLLTTGEFTIDEPWLGFVIGGSAKPYDLDTGGLQNDVTAVNLLIDGIPVRTATGSDRNLLDWHYWDVQEFQGREATLELIDSSSTGFLLADEFILTKRQALRDISSYREAAELVGSPQFTVKQSDAALGKALVFDGVDDAVLAHALEPLEGVEAFTLSAWVKIESRDRNQVILSKGDDFSLSYDADTETLTWQVGQVEVTSPRKINNSAFHFVAATFQVGQADGLRLWVDEVNQAASTSTESLATYPHTASILRLGGEGDQIFHGSLDDLRIRASLVSDEELLDSSTGSGPWIDVSLGHFDAGDYGKYMINSALALHSLIFTADQFLQLAGEGDPVTLDNLGIPESGDGIPDILQEAKWEADYIAKMQDADGGFFFLVHPRNRSFESNVLPSEGDPQTVWPKTLSATGSAVGALVEAATSPSFQHHYPEAAARYLEAGLRGWEFIEKAVDKYGVDGAFQRITHYGQLAGARDDVGWAAAALFAATGDPQYEARMIDWMPWNAETFNGEYFAWRQFRRYTWQRLYDATGAALRTYAFANSGARKDRSINFDQTLIGPKPYLGHVQDELLAGGDDLLAWADANPFRASVPTESKRFNGVTYFFGISEAFDLLTAYHLDPRPEYFEGMLHNIDYMLGANAANRTFISGLGWHQNHEYVSQFADNDERLLPPVGYNIGGVNTGIPFLLEYQGLLGYTVYPADVPETVIATPYGVYDRQTDVWNVSNEFVILNQARAFGVGAYLYHLNRDSEEPWIPAPPIEITGSPESAEVGGVYEVSLTSPDPTVDLTKGRIIWEAADLDYQLGSTDLTIQTPIARQGWIEAEVFWPDGKRSFARTIFSVTEKIDQTIEQYQPNPEQPGEGVYSKILGNGNVRLYYPLDHDLKDAMNTVIKWDETNEDLYALTSNSTPTFETGNFEWPVYKDTRPDFRPLAIKHSEDLLRTGERTLFADDLFPPHTQWISMEAIVFIDQFNMNTSAAYMPALDIEGLAQPVRLWLYKDPWNGPILGVYGQTQQHDLTDKIPLRSWLHLRTVMDPVKTVTYLNGSIIDEAPTEVFDTWLTKGNRIKVLLGGFQGYVSDLIIKAGTGEKESLDQTVPPPLSPFEAWLDWEFQGDTSLSSRAQGDPDGDGRVNLMEYALGSSPHVSDNSGSAIDYLQADNGDVSFRYSRPKDRDRTRLTYTLTTSTDMTTWSTFDPPLTPQVVEDDNGIVTYTYIDPRLQPDSTARFLRLEVALSND